jgi:hypothetical protein
LWKEIANYDGIMIDQPEIFVDKESKYQGMKPDDMKVLADTFREILIEEVKDDIAVVEKSGPRVLYLRLGLTGLYLKRKWSKNPLAYTPVGVVAHGVKRAVTKDLSKKVSLVEANLEWELMDSVTGEVLGAVVEQRGARKDKSRKQKADPTSWDEMSDLFHEAGARTACRLSNARRSEEEWVDCQKLPKPTAN